MIRLDGTCHWCGRRSPCAAQAVALRADAVARLPMHEAWEARDELTRLLPVLSMADPPAPRAGGHYRNERTFRDARGAESSEHWRDARGAESSEHWRDARGAESSEHFS